MNIASYSNWRKTRSAASANTSTPRRPRRFSSARRPTSHAYGRRSSAWRLKARQFPLTELYELSSPPLLSANELVGQRLPDDKSCEGNLSELENRSPPSKRLD